MDFEREIDASVTYLGSSSAIDSLAADPYWPKWDAPWWHMLLLHEMGHTSLIPGSILREFVAALNRYSVKIFPIYPGDMPDSVDPHRGCPCHCQLGNVYQVLAAAGIDVDQELPWIRTWFLRYQMADGGLTCDNYAYLVKDECPSSMVGTIAAFESILLHTPRPWTREESAFLDAGARFLMDRRLMHGSATNHNASERVSAGKWLRVCFPRYYYYDVLRGLSALLIWSEKTGNAVPAIAVEGVIDHLRQCFPDDVVRCERLAYEGIGTIYRAASGEWIKQRPAPLASAFPLLTATSALGRPSPFLSRHWREAKDRLQKLRLDA